MKWQLSLKLTKYISTSLALAAVALVVIGMSFTEAKAQSSTTRPATQPTRQSKKSAADVVDSMMKKFQSNPLVEPTNRPASSQKYQRSPLTPQPQMGLDPKVVGVAPGMKRPTLRREGEFVINRRGRLMRSPNGADFLYLFDADSQSGQEPPMMMVRCQILQSMEDLILERGDRVVFTISGQVLTYRGANLLLPTMMKLAINRGNLQH